uniref:Secreted protein n=1 Tax=Suricata suricatta TaxID=37032 RepID=A0A673SZ48_SURSU
MISSIFFFFLPRLALAEREPFIAFMYRKLNSARSAQFGGQFFSLRLLQLGDASHRLRTQHVASPVAADLIISVVVVGSDGFHQLSQSSFVFRVDLCEGDTGAGLPVDQAPQPGLPLDDAVGHPHLPTQGRQEDDQLDRIRVVCDHYQLSLLVLHQGGDGVNPSSKDRWPLSGDIPFAGSLLLSPGQQSLLLLLLALRPVFVGLLQQLSSCLAAQGLGELVNRRRHFEPFIENRPLPLQPNVKRGHLTKHVRSLLGWMS